MRSQTIPSSDHEPRARRRDKSLRVARTHVGLGVFAQRRYSAEQLVGEVEGQVIDDDSYGSEYCMDMGDERSLEPAAPFRFMNHSCQPNCCLTWYDAAGAAESKRRRVFVVALDDIAVDEQLTIDYGWPAHLAIPCRCRAPECRGWVVSEDELPKLHALHRGEEAVAAPAGG